MPTIDKTYSYKIYRDDVFLGLLPNVISEFKYSQDINTSAVQLNIEVKSNPYYLDVEPNTIDDDTGEPIQTDLSEALETSTSLGIYGSELEQSLIRNNNTVEVIEYSTRYPNGITVFTGFISRYKILYDGNTNFNITVLSHGTTLNDYIFNGGNYISEISQLTSNTQNDEPYTAFSGYWLQTFTPTVTFNLAKVRIKAALTGSTKRLRVEVHSGYVGGSANRMTYGEVYGTSSTAQEYDVVMLSEVEVQAGTQYFIKVLIYNSSETFSLFTQSTAPYSGGQAYRRTALSTITPQTSDLHFALYSQSSDTDYVFTNTDPTVMTRTAIEQYNSLGGLIVKEDGVTDQLTGLSLDYTFKVASILEVIEKSLELAPYDWYYYVDPGDKTFNFKQTSTTADYTIVLGKHVESIEIESTVENVINVVYFSGGDIGGGVNLYSKYQNIDSINVQDRQRMTRVSDNRVIVQATADAMADSILGQHPSEEYTVSLTLSDDKIDITLFKQGQIVGFNGFGNHLDNLLLQIVNISRYEYSVVLTLGVLPYRQSTKVQDIERQLDKQETIDNPVAPV